MYAADDDNPWVRDVRGSRRRWRGLAAAVSASVFAAGVLLVFRTWGPDLQQAIAGAVGRLPGAWPDIVTSGVLQCAIFGLFLAAALLATSLEKRRPWRTRAGGLAWLPGGLAIGAGGFSAAVALAAAAGAVVLGPSAPTPSSAGAILFGLAIVAIQSVAEEAFFRGWLQPVLCADWGVWVGLVVTSALFGALHVIAGAHGPLAVANLFLGGVLFGLLALRTGNLIAPAAAHFAWNWTESGVLGLTEDPSGSIVKLRFAGAPLWNGGEDAMNGSLATSLVLVALVAALFLWKTLPRARVG